MTKIVADDKIPYLKGAFEGKVDDMVYMPGAKTTAADVKDADAIVTRTRTRCNAALLEGSSVKIIAAATIGYDHIDTNYCESKGIAWTNAPGCNSGSVKQYIASALVRIAQLKKMKLQGSTLGVVGVGNAGSKAAMVGKALGMRVLLNDPPRERVQGSDGFTDFDTLIYRSDVITFHTPLIKEGIDKTVHLLDADVMKKLKKTTIIINGSRGEVVDNQALKQALKEKQIAGAVLDVWENEPDIDLELLSLVDIATPHIAGYSKDGKATVTMMSVQAVSRKLNLGIDDWKPAVVELPEHPMSIDFRSKNSDHMLCDAIVYTYDILHDSDKLKRFPSEFEKQRGDYPVRREFENYTIKGINRAQETGLKLLGFKLEA